MRGLLVLALIAVVGCDDCDGRPNPRGALPSRDGGIADLAPEPTNEEVLAMWTAASKDLAIAPAEPATLRYVVPSCALEYQLRVEHLSDVAPGRPPAGMEFLVDFAANPDVERLTWQVTGIDGWLLSDGERVERPVEESIWSPALVRTDGTAWHELQGPSTLWASHSAIPPLVWFFPTLPASAPGSAAKWKVVTHAQRTTALIEQRRADDPDAAIPNLRGDVREADLSLTEWIRVGDAPAAVMIATWSEHVTDDKPTETERAEKWRARFVVTANGRLLHAALAAGKYQWWALSEDEYNSKLGSAELELRLVKACDGPQLARFSSAPKN